MKRSAMRDGQSRIPLALHAGYGVLAALMLVAPALAQAPQNGAHHPRAIASFSVGPDQALVYVPYIFAGQGADGYQRMARAKLDDDDLRSNDPGRRLTFAKWYKGAFSEPGIAGRDSGVTPARGCTGGQQHGQISYDDAIDQYLLTFVCVSLQGQPGNLKPYQAAWYYSTATSLELQNWTMPQLIQNSQFPVKSGCANDGSGRSFDGWYPSFVWPNHAEGRLGATGQVFFMSGCETQKRRFMSRTFTIVAAPN